MTRLQANLIAASATLAVILGSGPATGTSSFVTSAQANTTARHIAACQRAKKGRCKMNTGNDGVTVIVTGSGGVVWCPPETDGKCKVVTPGNHPQ